MGSHKMKGAALLVLVAVVTWGCESSDVLAPISSQIILEASPATVFIDVNAGETEAQSAITAVWFDSTGAFPLEGLDVTFSTTGGTIAPTSVVTDGNGAARTVLTLGLQDPTSVTVTVRSGTISDSIIVARTEGEPTAVILADPPDSQRSTQSVTFDGRGSSDPDGEITCYQWSIAGVTTETVQNPTASRVSRSFALEQDLTVTLRVSDRDDANTFCFPGDPADPSFFSRNVASIDYEIYCDRTGPVVTIVGGDRSVALVGGTATVGLVSTASDPETLIESYEWLCLANDPNPQTTANATCVYDETGTYTAQLTVTNGCDTPASQSVVITVTS